MLALLSETAQQVVAVDPLKAVWKCRFSPQNLEYMASCGGATELYVMPILGSLYDLLRRLSEYLTSAKV
jgi:hypothetical protein